jgi:hypothetical protein
MHHTTTEVCTNMSTIGRTRSTDATQGVTERRTTNTKSSSQSVAMEKNIFAS